LHCKAPYEPAPPDCEASQGARAPCRAADWRHEQGEGLQTNGPACTCAHGARARSPGGRRARALECEAFHGARLCSPGGRTAGPPQWGGSESKAPGLRGRGLRAAGVEARGVHGVAVVLLLALRACGTGGPAIRPLPLRLPAARGLAPCAHLHREAPEGQQPEGEGLHACAHSQCGEAERQRLEGEPRARRAPAVRPRAVPGSCTRALSHACARPDCAFYPCTCEASHSYVRGLARKCARLHAPAGPPMAAMRGLALLGRYLARCVERASALGWKVAKVGP
jgi:hypothetical protein